MADTPLKTDPADDGEGAEAGPRRKRKPFGWSTFIIAALVAISAALVWRRDGPPPVRPVTALIIDILLWGSLIGVGVIAWRQDKAVLTVALRKGGMDFVNIVPRIALCVIGSGFIAAIIPSEVIVGGLGRIQGGWGLQRRWLPVPRRPAGR